MNENLMRLNLATPLFSTLVLACLVLSCFCQHTSAKELGDSDWPQWRGPTRDGHAASNSADGSWPDSIDEEHLTERWRVELAPSYSGPIVVGNQVFTTETREEKTEVVTAYDLTTGKRAWETQWPGSMTVPFFAASNGSWIRATPITDGKTLFVVGIQDVLVALNLQDGKEVWRIDFPKDTNSDSPKFGAASSPFLFDNAIYVQMGGSFTKVNKETGEIIWQVAKEEGGMMGGAFSSPYLSEINGQPIALVQARDELKGIDPDSGDLLWSQPIEAFRGMNILTPTVYDGKLFTSAHSGRSQLWKIESTDQQATESEPQEESSLVELWRNKSQAYMSSPVIVGKHLYMHLKNQRIQCLDLETGEETWRTTPFGKYQSMVVLGDRILALDASGELILFEANPNEFNLIERRKISEADTWAYLAVCGNQIVVRELNALVVYDWK